MLWLFAFLLTPVLSAPPVAATPLVTLSSAHGDKQNATWERQISVSMNGRWTTADGRSGTLANDDLTALKRAIDDLDLDTEVPRERCRARAIMHERLTTRRGILDDSRPCGIRWSAQAADLAQHLRALTAPTEGSSKAVLLSLSQASIRAGAWQDKRVLFEDGRWEIEDGAKGQLAAADLKRLREAIAKTTFDLAPEQAIKCEAMPTTRQKVTSGAKSVTWEFPCGSEPSESVHALLNVWNKLIIGAP